MQLPLEIIMLITYEMLDILSHFCDVEDQNVMTLPKKGKTKHVLHTNLCCIFYLPGFAVTACRLQCTLFLHVPEEDISQTTLDSKTQPS